MVERMSNTPKGPGSMPSTALKKNLKQTNKGMVVKGIVSVIPATEAESQEDQKFTLGYIVISRSGN